LGKKCIICGEEAEFCIKGTSDYYCKGCAEEHFGDINVLQKVEEEAKRLKEFIKKKIEGENDEAIPDDEQPSSD
jgi:hypothetical protein